MTRGRLYDASILIFLFLAIQSSLLAQDAAESGAGAHTAGMPLDPEAILRQLQNDVLRVIIRARVIAEDDTVVWNMEMDELTVSGRGVEIRLNGENLAVKVQFTPYRQEKDSIMLVAQSQNWVKNANNNKLIYQTSLKSLSVTTDEPVLFYPLGVDPDNGNRLNLELEIMISRYNLEKEPRRSSDDGDE